jgi:hypothetical protein
VDERDVRNASVTYRTNPWRAGCDESRTSGSEGGPEKRTGPKGQHRAPGRPYALSSPQHLGREQLARVVELAAQIANEEGFRLNPAKTRVQRRGQRQSLAGIVINERPNVERHEYERLKATVHNAVRHGPESQNRDGHPDYRSHLLGRVSRVNQLNPGRGQRLLAAFAQVDWQST